MDTTGQVRPRSYRGQAGNTLLITLAIIGFMTVVIGALVGYANTSQATAKAFREVRDDRFDGDAAVEAAVNWVANMPNVGRDPDLTPGDPDCFYESPAEGAIISVSCGAEAGSGSGRPAEVGLLPPEGLLLLGDRSRVNSTGADRDETTGPYNTEGCKGWWNTFTGWFNNGTDPESGKDYKEASSLFRPHEGLGTLAATCGSISRSMGQFQVEGNVVAAGRIQGYGTTGGFQAMSPGVVKARYGCAGGGMSACPTLGTRAAGANVPPRLVGSPEDSDPARYPRPAPNATRHDTTPTDIHESWQSIPFDGSGALRSGYSLPERTSAYVLNAAGDLVAQNTCPTSADTTIIFLPGWYKDAEVLNKFTSPASGCVGRTFWLAPDPGASGKLLDGDDVTGAFYFDFRQTSAIRECGRTATGGDDLAPAHRGRWCIGRNGAQNPRVVVGTPAGWSPVPLGAAASDDVNIDVAGTIDNDLSRVWTSASGARQIGAGGAARYAPDTGLHCLYNIFNPFTCTSVDRSIRLRNFSPNITSGPSGNTVFVTVRYGFQDPNNRLADPKIEVRTVTNASGHKLCGTFTLPRRMYTGGGLTSAHDATISTADAQTLFNECGSVDQINGYEIRMITEGNPFNFDSPNIYLDGMRIHFGTYRNAQFPQPQAGSPLAERDCDPSEPGAQLIFGGDSHVFVADGSLEICAGSFPTNPSDHQSIGVYAAAAVEPILPTSIVKRDDLSTQTGGDFSLVSSGNISKIDSKEVTFSYEGCAAYCGREYEVATAQINMRGYTPPTGYSIAKVEARVSYNPKNSGCSALWDCPGANPQFKAPNCGWVNFPKNPDRGPLHVANWSSAVLYDTNAAGTVTKDCLNTSQLASGAQLLWAARAECVNAVILGWICKAGGGRYSDSLDGIELDITLRPTNNSVPRLLPQSGCIVAWPNYNAGEGTPDCAILKSSQGATGDRFNWPWTSIEGESNGRFAVNGTIYAPSSALEIDDTDAAYSLVQRGAVLRHLRIAGFAPRPGTNLPAISNSADLTPEPRQVDFVACIQTDDRRTAKETCDAGAGDQILTSARVNFVLDPGHAYVPDQARVPSVQWWRTET